MLIRDKKQSNNNYRSQQTIAEAAQFVIGYALAQLWQAWGIQPRTTIGLRVGELVAACIAEVFNLSDAVALVAMRGRLLATTENVDTQSVEPDVDALVTAVQQLSLQKPKVPYLSTVTGTWVTADEALDPVWWGRQLSQPTRFAGCLNSLIR